MKSENVSAGNGGDPLLAERWPDAGERRSVGDLAIAAQPRHVRGIEAVNNRVERHSRVGRLELVSNASGASVGKCIAGRVNVALDAATVGDPLGVLPADLEAEPLAIAADALIDAGLELATNRLHRLTSSLSALPRG